MIEFWLSAGLLLLAALGFLLIPVLRGRKVQAEEDRTALNVTLYQERLQELENQRQAGTLSDEQWQNGRDDAARELLADTDGAESKARVGVLGSKVPLTAALLMPLLGYGLYLYWGAIDDVERARTFAEQPQTIEAMTARLEASLKADPKSAEGWYFLGRTYMAQERAADAATAFERAVDTGGRDPELLGQWAQALYFAGDKQWTEQLQTLTDEALKADPKSAEGWYFLGRTYMAQERAADAATAFERAVDTGGRDPELLGQWAQALYFAGDKQWTEQLQTLTDEALKADPAEVTSLGLLGIAAYEEGRFEEAIGFWERLVAVLPEQDPSRQAIQGGIARARERLATPTDAPPAAAATGQLRVKVDLAAALKDKVEPGDSVFVFARAASGPPMPLAVKRLTVADLPAEVSLSDSDAMMPQLKISGFEQVQLVARISRSGNATAGEWIGLSQPLPSSTTEAQQLTIDTADGQAQ